MTPKPRIPPESWESRKEVIIDLYLKQGKKLADVIEILAKDHSFYASKSQYVLQLSKWNVEKNSSKDVWTSAAALVRKRKLEGKQTEIYIDGKKVPEKKLKKALSRPSISQDEPVAHLADTMVGTSNVTAYSPRPDHTEGIEISGLPWFHFQSLLETSFINLAIPPSSIWNVSGAPHLALTGNAGSQGWREVSFPSDFMRSPGCILENNTPPSSLDPPSLSEAPASSTTMEQASREARFALEECLLESTDPEHPNHEGLFSAILKETTIKQEGELVMQVEHLFSKSSFNAAYQPLRYAAYLSSNDLLSGLQTARLVHWVAKNDNLWAIERLLDHQLPTIEIFCGNLLVAAADLGEISIVKALLSKGIDPNYLGGCGYYKETALHRASRRETIGLVDMLLRNGAKPDIYSIGRSQTPFEVALSCFHLKRPDTPPMMIRAGAKVVRSLPNEEQCPYLAMAAKFNSLELVQAMLSAGAPVNDDTGSAPSALQIATENGNLEMVETLLVAGADVNYPTGGKYRKGRKQLVTDYSDPNGNYLQTPLHFAISQDNMEMIQVLIEAGAHVNSCQVLEYLPWLHPNSDNEDGKDDCDMTEDEDIFDDKVSASKPFIDAIEDPFGKGTYNAAASTPLEEAVWQNNAAAVRLLLRLGADIDAAGGFATALQAAATVEEGCHMIKLLLSKGADVNIPARGRGAMTALQAAASAGNEEAVELLLKAKADINAPPSSVEGRTALQAAVETGKISLVRSLIRAGANVNAQAAPKGGKTCLQAAAEAGNVEMFNLLLPSGTHTHAARYYFADKALKAAIEMGRHDEISKLFRTYITGAREGPDMAVLITTAIHKKNPVLAQRLFARAIPTVRMRGIQSFLTTAIKADLLSLVQLFIEAGANVNAPHEGELPVEIAVQYTRPACLKALLKAGADVQGIIGAKAVAQACETFDTSEPSMLHFLLSAGASPKKVPGYKSPLHLATKRWRIKEEVVRLLLLHGADAKEDSGIPLKLAAAQGCVPVVDLLLQAGADVNAPASHAYHETSLQGAVKTLRTDLVEKLLDAGADINALPSPKCGTTALQAAVYSGSSTMVRLLLSRGADVNVNGLPSPAYGATALHEAVMKGNLVITSLLLKHGADVSAPAAKSHGRTALEVAAEHGRLDILYLLLRNDEDPETFSLRCKRGVKLAETSGNLVLARLLEEWRISYCEAGTGSQ